MLAEKQRFRPRVNIRTTLSMGDRSPKSNQKKSTQKQAAASKADQQKKQAVAAKTAGAKKK